MTTHRAAKVGLLACCAGLALGAVGAGNSRELTALPPAIVVAFGASAALLALAQARQRSTVVFLACGAACGALLPRDVAASGAVITHALATRQRGDLFELLDRIDAEPRSVFGRRVTVFGEWSPATSTRAATVSRRIMTCCAADAVRVGFDVFPSRGVSLLGGTGVRVTGIVTARSRDGDVRYALTDASVDDASTSARAAGALPDARSSRASGASPRGRDGALARP